MVVSRVDFLHNIPKNNHRKEFMYIMCIIIYRPHLNSLLSACSHNARQESNEKYIEEEVRTQTSAENRFRVKKINFVTLVRLFGIYKILEHIYIQFTRKGIEKVQRGIKIITSSTLKFSYVLFLFSRKKCCW